jgi:transcriptional regulator with XRE-family HTH domain
LGSKKFCWTEGLDSILKRSYRTSRNRNELIRNLTYLQRVTGFPRFAITSRASALGIARIKKQPWTTAELSHLRELAGRCGRTMLAKRLGRSEYSVKAALKRLMLSARISEGYSRSDLVELLGASPTSVRRWERMGWLVFGHNGRASEASVRRFLRIHPDQYQLSFVNEAWFKGLLFEAYNSPSPGHREKNISKKSADADANSTYIDTTTDDIGESIPIGRQKDMAALAPNPCNRYQETA